MRLGCDRVSQQIFGLHAQSRCDDPHWRRLRFPVSSLLSQAGGECKPGSGEVWRLDHRFSQKVLEFRPLLQRYVAAGGAKILLQQQDQCGPGSGGARRQSNGAAQHILRLRSQAARAERRRYVRDLSGRAIRVGNLPSVDRVHPCDGVAGSPRTPQLQADTGCHQREVGARRRDGQQRRTGHIDRRAGRCATTLPNDATCPEAHDTAPPQNARRPIRDALSLRLSRTWPQH